MKSYLLPLAAVTGTMITLGLTAVTLAGPADAAESPAAAQVRQMEQQSRLREWSQGLGVDLSGRGTMVAQAELERSVSGAPKSAPGIPTSVKNAGDRDADRKHDKHDRAATFGHEDDDADEGHS